MKRMPMRKIRDVLRLSAEGLSTRQIAASLAIGRTTLRGYLDRAAELGLSWPLPPEMSDTDLERRLFDRGYQNTQRVAAQPDWAHAHRELRRKGVTLSLLWEEYRSDYPEGYGYSRFCELYTRWEGKLSPVMRQRHPAGERLFVDYAGPTIDVIDPKTGEVRTAQLFVATLGASNYTHAEATWTQSLPDWIASHVRAFDFFGGVTAQVVSDNLKAGVTKACFYDPVINRTYADLAAHYDTAVVPARPPGPGDHAAWAATLASRPDLAPAVGFDDCIAWACRVAQDIKSPGAAEAEPAVRRLVDGLAHRSRALRLLGNGVHPLAAAHAWRALAAAHGLGPVDLATGAWAGGHGVDKPL